MKSIHLVANAHLDPVWLWRWEEGCTAAISTFHTVCDLLDEYEDFVFCHNEALLYEWVRELTPGLFRRIQAHVAAGRWRIMGGWYLQPDCNMPSGESMVRNILLGLGFFREHFGVRPRTACNFDAFGHSLGLIQILEQAGFDAYLSYRPGPGAFPFPDHDFEWRGLAGSQVVMHRSHEGYNSVWGFAADKLRMFLGHELERPPHQAHPEVDPAGARSVRLFLWGVGDHGGGPTRTDLDDLDKLIRSSEGEQIRHSDPDAYFAELKEFVAGREGREAGDMPLDSEALTVYRHHLNPTSQGCYSTQVRVKQKHRELENELYSTEKLASRATLLYGRPYPAKQFGEALRDLIFAEFHDALPGTGTPGVEEDTLQRLGHGLEIVRREKLAAVLCLSQELETAPQDMATVVLCNPHPYPYRGTVVFETSMPRQNWSHEHLFLYPEACINGVPLPTQAEKEESNFSLDWRKRVVVEVDLAPSSVSRCDLSFRPLAARPRYEPIMGEREYSFRSDDMEVTIDLETGLMSRYRSGDVEYLAPTGGGLFTVDDGYSPWGIGSSHSQARRPFALADGHETARFAGLVGRVIQPIRVIEDGAVRTVVEAVFACQHSRALIRYILPKRGSYIDLELVVDFREPEQTLKLGLPLAGGEAAELWGQIMFGRDRMFMDGREDVHQKWVMAERADGEALAVLNRGTHGVSWRDGSLELTLLRSAGYTASDLMEPAYSADQWAPRMEQGRRHFAFRIVGGEAVALGRRVDQLAQCFNEGICAVPFRPLGREAYDTVGEAPAVVSETFLTIDNPSITMSALKLAEEQADRTAEEQTKFILRLHEGSGERQTAVVEMAALGLRETVEFEPFAIRSFLLDSAGRTLTECTLTEGL
ncbi:MAG: glycoside hydrolase family 38 C-terminal domain-containing protein [Bacillota bacterium]|nr:glycoside hydrolase family 38 C-terminal domain-containing protein [Bacillota bacterium]